MAEQTRRHYVPANTAQAFHNSKAMIRGFKGPVGNGKSVACLQELRLLGKEQHANCDGIRKTRFVIIRNTYPELRTTTLNTYKQWFPAEIAPVVTSPIITSILRYQLPDNTIVESEFIFMAVNTEEDVGKLLSLEVTAVFINEARELPYAVVMAARQRLGRYPAEIDGYKDTGTYTAPRGDDGKYRPCRRPCLIMDTNPPDNEHWWYHLAVNGHLPKAEDIQQARKETAEIFEFFDAPSPLIKDAEGRYHDNPEAENIDHLPDGYQYYYNMLAGNTAEHINVMVMGNYGALFNGKPVYSEYNNVIHCDTVTGDPEYPLCLGWDFGHTPACVFGQLINGQMRVIAEVWSDDANTKEFARDTVKPYIAEHFADYKIGFSLADPAGNQRGEGEGKASIGILNDKHLLKNPETGEMIEQPLNMGFVTQPAPGHNDPTLRINAVNSFMLSMKKGRPCYQVDRRCGRLVRGKQGGYHYRMVQGTNGIWAEKPNKNHYSHVADAEQYLALGFQHGMVRDVRVMMRELDEEKAFLSDYAPKRRAKRQVMRY